MLLCIGSILKPDELAEVQARIAAIRFIDGKETAGWHARLVKTNLQADPADPQVAPLRKRLAAAIEGNELFAMAARPRRLGPLLLSRYEPGMGYGRHVDDALMGETRSDVSFTLFLSDPGAYDGGELVMEGTGGEQAYKLPAGSLILYPSTTLHRVSEVTRGVRLAAVGWAQSLVRDPAERELLFDLDTARRQLFREHGKSAAFDLVSKSLTNLLRRWAET